MLDHTELQRFLIERTSWKIEIFKVFDLSHFHSPASFSNYLFIFQFCDFSFPAYLQVSASICNLSRIINFESFNFIIENNCVIIIKPFHLKS